MKLHVGDRVKIRFDVSRQIYHFGTIIEIDEKIFGRTGFVRVDFDFSGGTISCDPNDPALQKVYSLEPDNK